MKQLIIELNVCPSDYITENIEYGIGMDVLRANTSYVVDEDDRIIYVYGSTYNDLQRVVTWLMHPKHYISDLSWYNERVPEWDSELRFRYTEV